MDAEQLLFEKGWRDQGRVRLAKKAWGKDVGRGIGPGVAAPVTSIGAKLAAKEIAGHQVTLTPPVPKKPGKIKAPARTGAFSGHAPSSGYSVKGEEMYVLELVKEGTMSTATKDEFYVFTEDGITKLAGPFATEDAAIAEIEKFAAEVAAEKRDFTQAERDEAEKKGHAMPGGGFPINTAEDLANAKQAVGRAKDPAAARAHINEQAARLGKPGLSKFGERFWDLVKDAASLPSWGASLVPTDGGEGGTERQVSEAADRPTDNVSSGSHIVIQVAPATENGEAAGLTLAPVTEDGADLVQKYAITKSAPEQRYTLGVAYPANRVDVHGDFMDAADLEKSAWAFISKADAGTMHVKGTEGAGQVVESYIHRGPAYKSEGGDEVRPGDWLLGVVWGQPTWDRISKGELKGFSFQGYAKRSKSAAPK